MFGAPPTADTPPPEIPDHTLVRCIGKGSYGEVWLARNIMGTWRAVKIVWRDRFVQERPYEREFEGIKRFEPVSRSHDSQVDILHIGRNQERGYFYYVMELGDDEHSGQIINPDTYTPRTLRSELDKRGRIPPEETLEVGIALATALEHLHSKGLIHRDVKPSNVIFIHGHAKLADIGLVAAADEHMSFVGTAGFVPPEGPGSERADLFSLGRVLYEMHTGYDRSRFPELPTDILEMTPDRRLAQELNLIILKACESHPESRHANIRELREELQLLQNGRSIARLRNAERRAAAFRQFALAAGVIAAFALVGYFSARSANLRADAHARSAEAALVRARLSQAHALRVSGRAGRRDDALGALMDAARIAPSQELRSEAIATLSLTDFGGDALFLEHPSPDAASKAQGDPRRVQFSPDGTKVAWCRGDSSILIANVSDGSVYKTIPETDQSALGLSWSKDGRYLGVSHRDRVRIYRFEDLRLVVDAPAGPEPDHDGGVLITFSANSERVAFSRDGNAVIHELPSGHMIRQHKPIENMIGCVLHPEQSLLAAYTSKEITIWDYDNFHPVKVLPVMSNVIDLAWSPDGRVIAAGLRDTTIFVADVTSREKHVMHGHNDRPNRVMFNPTGTLLLSTSRDGNTRAWNPLAGVGLASTYRGWAIGFTPDGERIGFTRYNGVGFWPTSFTGRAYRSITGRLNAKLIGHADFSPDGQRLVSIADGKDGIWMWDLTNGRTLCEGVGSGAQREWVSFTGNGHHLLTLGRDGMIHWPVVPDGDPAKGKLTLGAPQRIAIPTGANLSDIACLNHDGSKLLARIAPNKALLINLEEPTEQQVLETDVEIGSLAFSPDDRYIAVGTRRDGSTQVLRVEPGFPVVKKLPAGDANVAFSPNGKWLVNFTRDRCEFWDVGTFTPGRSFPRLRVERNPGEMDFSSDGRYFAYLKQRDQAELVDANTLEVIATFELPNQGQARKLCFSPGGEHLALYTNGQLHLYHLPSMREELAKLGLDW